ncbi:MAG: UDP-N-acetylglucosamine 1-carboxyvinyltransferase [Candidatus Hatepunaea meridiana]|nr:UDP-N-acetylglucosamine 1-carboxyvinyltransferase [Candidatus Hatepunaea meridiana]
MMDHFVVEGGRPLSGTITCSGAKNAALPLMAASLLTDGVTVLNNIPDLQDVRTMAMVLRVIGADVRIEEGTLTIDCSHCNFWEAPYELVRKMRASFYVLGPLIARFGEAKVSLPGGCALGPRPVDLHLKAMKRLGCDIYIESGYVNVKAKSLKGTRINMDVSSVGATGNLMMAACAATGTTVINNSACEPEIIDLANMLNAMGADINGAGSKQVEINGPVDLKPVKWKVIPDRIEAGTFLLAAAVTRGKVTLKECRADLMYTVLDKINETGVNIQIDNDSVTIDARDVKPCATDVITEAYPGFPTDLQAPWTVFMSLAKGDSILTETIYPERFTHVPELIRLGAQFRKKLNSIYIEGVERFTGASVMCSDIRAAAALVIATLAAEGTSKVLRVYHLDRGYDRMEDKLSKLGAKIRRIRE